MANKRPPGRRSQAESARTRERILDRAERLFARRGYAAVSLREVAAAAGVRPFTVQHHFGSKSGLYQEALCRFDADLMKRLGERAAGAGSLRERIGALLDDLFDFFFERRDWVRLNARAALGDGVPRGVARADRSWLRFVDGLVDPRELGLGDVDLRLLLLTVEGVLNQHLLADESYRALFGADLRDPMLRDRARDHVRRVVLALVEGERPR